MELARLQPGQPLPMKYRSSEDGAAGEAQEEACQADSEDKFLSWTFLLYYLVCLYNVMVVLFAGWKISRRLDDRTPGSISLHSSLGLQKYMKHSLDVADPEWRINRMMAIPVALMLAAFVSINRLICIWKVPWLRTWFYSIAGLSFAGYMHGAFVSIHIIAAVLNYAVAHVLAGTSHGLSVIWAVNLSNLLLSHASPARDLSFPPIFRAWPARYPWQWPFWLGILRILSYSLELHEARKKAQGLDSDGQAVRLKSKPSKEGLPPVTAGIGLSGFHAASYCAYIFYPPLYLLGPLLKYPAFAAQMDQPPQFNRKKVFNYGAWTFLYMGILELFCVCFFTNGFARSRLWQRTGKLLGYDLDGADLMAMAILNLVFIYLKFHVFWSFSRFWSLADNLWAPENNQRSLLYIHSFKAFLRRWNVSLHMWMVSYVYKPLGGHDKLLRNSFIVFNFVALLSGINAINILCAALAALVYTFEQVILQWMSSVNQGSCPSNTGLTHMRAFVATACIVCLASLCLVSTVFRENSISFFGALCVWKLQCGILLCVAFALSHILLALHWQRDNP